MSKTNEIIEGFLSKYASGNTRRCYRRMILEFVHWAKISDGWTTRKFKDITKKQCHDYHGHLYTLKGYSRYEFDGRPSTGTVRYKIATLRLFWNYLIDCDQAPTNPWMILQQRERKPSRKPTNAIPFERVPELLALCDNSKEGVRDRAMMSCLFGGGLRISETLAINICDVVLADPAHLILRNTKSQETQQQAIPEWTKGDVKRLVIQRLAENAPLDSALFSSYLQDGRASGRISGKTAYRNFKRYAGILGMQDVSPHSARATAITRLLDQGFSYKEVQEFSRHQSVRMVEQYDKRFFGLEKSAAKKLEY